MTIYPLCTSLMKFNTYRNIVEKYYAYKVKRPCFLLHQNDKWTIVMINM